MEGFFNSGPCSAQMTAIHRISSALFAQADVDTMLLETLEVSMQTADAEAGSILLYDRGTKQLVFRHALGPEGAKLVGRAVNLEGTGKSATVFKTGKSDISVEGFDHPTDIEDPTRSTLTTAIKNFGGEPIGVVQVLNKRNGLFDNRDKELLEIVAAMAATVIDNAQRAEERKQAALARILTYVGHQLKNKTFIIDGADKLHAPTIEAAIQALGKGDLSNAAKLAEAFAEYRSWVNDANRRAMKLAQGINAYADRKDLFEFTLHDLKAALEDELAPLVEMAPRFGGAVDLSGLTPVPEFRFDALFVSQAVYNLVDNATKAMPRERPPWKVEVITEARSDGQYPEGSRVDVVVRDDGPGIPPDKMEKILRGEAEPDPNKFGSTGIGTRLVYDVALTHGGEFSGESVVGQGTEFRVRLPLNR